MPVAQGLLKQTVFAKQSGLGVAATTGGKIKRRTSSVFTLGRDTFDNPEIVSHQQSTGSNAGIVKTAGKLDAVMSPNTYADLFESLLRKLAALTSPITGLSLTIAPAAGQPGLFTVTRAAGDFIGGGLKVGDVIRITAGAVSEPNKKNLLIVSMTATVLTVRPLNGGALVGEGPVASCTVTTPGKKIWVPLSGHTNEYWSVEEWYSDLNKSELFTDVKIGKADLTLPATGNATVSFDCPGLKRTRANTPAIASPAAETTTNVLTAVNGAVVVGNTVTTITGASLSITGNVAPGEAEVGSNQISDMIRGEVAVSGQFTAKFSASTLQDLYDNQSVVSLVLSVADGPADLADFVTFVMPAVKLFGDSPDDGEAKEIIRTYPFTAQIPATGGATFANHQTIISIQDSLAV